MIYYAKSKPDVLTIVEHTVDVVQAVKALAQAYGKELSFFTQKDFELLELAAIYHDLGKYSESFQNAIRPTIERDYKRLPFKNYPHNYLSVACIPFNELKKSYSKIDAQRVTLAVAFHHERKEQPTEVDTTVFYQQFMEKSVPFIKEDFPFTVNLSESINAFAIKTMCNRSWIVEQFTESEWYNYILLKGLLQRADHAASAKRKEENVADYIEEAIDADVGEQTKAHLEKRYALRPLQVMTYNNQHKNIVLIAQTGSGKTEAALLWIGKRKGFITLPFRVSLNVMFERIHSPQEINFQSTGLLHSSALDYLFVKSEEEDSYEQSILQTEHTRRLAKKLTLSTIDQLFKFPLLYRGFETELATLAYSKVVIDEIQAYDPHIVAILLKGIEMIHHLGGQWMIMTATLPQIFIDELNKRGLLNENTLVETMFVPDDRDPQQVMPRRHRIKLLSASIEDSLMDIVDFAQTAKVLVVVNTVKQALALFDQLTPYVKDKLYLLHSQFTQRDRLPKEEKILQFAKLENNIPGIWITTQIVEASLDVDFDYLFTEAATPDTLFQRFGRCNRKGQRFKSNVPMLPNVFIFTNLEEVSGIESIYERQIVEKGLDALVKFDGQLLGENEKIHIVATIFSEEQLAGTKYLAKFKQANDELKTLKAFERDKQQAQQILRDIQSCSLVPGRKNYEVVMELMEQYEQLRVSMGEKEFNKQRRKLRLAIEQYTVSVNYWRLKYMKKTENYALCRFSNRGFEHLLYSTDVLYTENRGLELRLDEDFDQFV